MTRPPIPDEVLRDFVESERELVSLPGYGTVSCSDMGAFGEDLARELLALRECVRGILDGGAVFCYHTDRNLRAEAFALLPEPPEAK